MAKFLSSIGGVALSVYLTYLIFTNLGSVFTGVMYVALVIVGYLFLTHVLGTPFAYTVKMGGVVVEKRIYRRFRRIQ